MDRSIHILFTNLRVFGLACCALLVVAQGSAQTPSWRWSFGLASGDPEHFRALGVDDAEGSIYVVGDAENTGISIGPINLLDQDQGMLIKFDQWGNIVWYAPIGGSDQETAENIAVAPNGNVYVTGAFSGSCYFYNAGSSVVAHQLTSFSGSNDIYVAAFSPSGTFLWARQFGNGNDEGAPDIAADATGIALTGYHRNTLSISGNSSSGSLSTTTNSIFLIRFDLNGTLQWMVNGGTSSDDQPATIASDGTRIYVGLVAGNTNLRWYNTSNAQLNSSTQTRADHVIVAFNVNGTWAWGMSINDPSNSVMGYPNLVTTCDGVYVAGSVGGGSTFSSTTIAGTNALAYYMRLRPASGVMDWVRIGNAANSADRFNPRDIATGKNGLIHIGGTYNGTATYGTSTISSASGSDLFVLTVGTDGTFKRLTAINSDDEQYLSSIAADAYGGVIIAGSYEDEVNIPGYALSGPSSNENAFIGFAQLGDREPDATNPALFVAPTALCSGTAVDLSTWRVPNAAGTATAVTTSTNTTAPTNATLAWDNNRALLQGGSGTLSLDLGTIVPATEGIHIRWRRTPGSANAPTLRYETSVDGTNWAAGTTTTTRTNYLITVVTLTAPARYIRLTALTNGGSIDLDGVAYRVGTTTGGTWSGTNVSGSTFNPGTTATSASITYTTPGSCNRQHTASVAIQQAPVPGSITVVQDAATCPGNNHGSLTLSGTAAPVVRWESSTNNFATVETIANTTQTLAFANLDASRTYRAVLSGGTCGQAYSGIGTVNVVDNQPPVITCPGSITVPVTAGSCTATILYSAPVVTDNCNGSAPLELAQHTYLGTFQGHTYFRSWAAGGWTAANTAATSIPNGHLISVNSAAEEDWLNSVILTQTGTHAPFWIGLNDALSEGNFVWANGDPGSFSHWAASQPDDSGGADHVYMNMGNAPGWDDAPGTTNFNWIVEIDALPIIAPQLISGPASGSVLPAGTDTVRYMATDRSGNTSACRFTIAVIDQEPPVIVNTPTTILVNAGANCTAPATWTAPTVTDNCGGASISRTDGPSSGSAFPLGATNITYTAIDAAGNDTSSSFVVKVIDTQRPTALCKADTIGLNAYGVATVWPVHINAGSTDNCAITSMQVDPDTFTTTGVFNVRFIVADASGNRDSCNTTVTVVANNCIASLYLEGNTDGSHIPVGRLRNTAPTRAALGNYDPGADSAAGHLLKKGNGNVNENDERRYQIWLFPATTTSLNGPASLSLWTAVKDMDPSKGGHLRAYLVDLLADGSDRTVIATANIQRAIWHAVPAAWMAETFDFGTINHTPAIGRRLGVMLTAPNSSGDDMWIAYDALSFPATISIAANTPPEITCPPSQQVAITSATCGMVVAYPAPLFTDNCPGANMTRTGGLASGSVFPEGTTTNTYQVSDADGNTATCSFTVEVLDHSAPIITCPGNVTVEAASGACSALVGYAAAVFDNCVAAPTLIWSHAPNSVFPVGSTMVTVRATDGIQQSPTCSFTVTVIDDQAPVIINCPANISVDTDPGECGAVATYAVTAIDNCGGTPTLIWSHAPGTHFPTGSTTVTVRATDGINTSTPCTFTVTVNDAESPTMSCPGAQVVNAIAGTCAAPVSFSTVPTDNCDAAPGLVWSHAPGSSFPLGSTTVSVFATDGTNVSTTCSFTVTVVDAEAPVMSCPLNMVVDAAPGSCDAVVTYAAPASDGCAASLNHTWSHPPGSVFPIGTTVVTVSSSDGTNSSAPCSFTVTVQDVSAPHITDPPVAATYYSTTTTCGHLYTLPAITSIDSCASPAQIDQRLFLLEDGNTTWQDLSGTAQHALAPGSHRFRAIHSDPAGNSDTCMWDVTVIDTIAPTILVPATVEMNTDTDACDAVVVFNVAFADNCAIAASSTIPPSGSSFPVGQTLVECIAEDIHGNITTSQFLVVVKDDQVPELICPTSLTAYATASACATPVHFITSASDNCASSPALTWSHPSGTLFPTGSTVVHISTTDGTNVAQCDFTVTVIDTMPPAFACPDDLFLATPAGECEALVTFSSNAVDNCVSNPTLTWSHTPGTMWPVGVHTVTGSATDGTNTSEMCSFLVTIIDQAPAVDCPVDITVNANAGTCTASVTQPVLDSSSGLDACEAWTIQNGPADWSAIPVGQTQVTYLIANTNDSTTCEFHVTVVDAEAPTVQCPATITVNTLVGECGAAITFAATAMDNCSAASISYTQASGSTFPIGTTTVIATATDGTSTAQCAFDVVVIGTTPVLDYAINSVCSSSAPLLPIIPSTPSGTFTATPPGLSIDAGSGAIDPASSAPGSYTISYIVPGTCNTLATDVVTIEAPEQAFISYPGSPYCNTGLATVANTSSVAGTYSGTPGLVVHPSTGSVDLALSSTGTHTVTFNVPATASCPTVTSTTALVISALPSVSISYPTAPFCTNTGQQSPVITGPTGGSFSATPPGLALNTATGTIDAGSTNAASAGTTYTITYTVPAANGCSSVSSSTSIQISNAPWAGISGTRSICSSDAPSGLYSSLTGTPSLSGTWTNPSNAAHSGIYDPSIDQAGIYTYHVVAGPGCASASSTVTVYESILPAAAISYPNSTQCAIGSVPVTRSGSAGGTYSGTAGLILDNNTGTIDLGQSNVGNHMVTYTLAAAGACPQVQTNTSVNIVAPASAGLDSVLTLCSNSIAFDLNSLRRGASTGGTWKKQVNTVFNGTVDPSFYGTGTHSYRYVVQGGLACPADSSLFTLTYLPPPTAGSGQPATICTGGSVELNDLLIGETPGGTWYDAGGAALSGTVTPTATTMYNYTVSTGAACPPGTISVTVTVDQTNDAGDDASVSICSLDAPVDLFTVLGGTPDNGGVWTGPSALSAGVYDPSLAVPGTYSYTIASSGPCATVSAEVVVNEVVAIAWYADGDGDNVGAGPSTLSCTPIAGHVTTNGDDCANDPNKVLAGACGCGVVDTDSDGDGVADCIDPCPIGANVVPGAPCDDNNAATDNDVYSADCTCAGSPVDCAGIVNGTASVDACGTCAGGTTGIAPNAACTDCAGVVNGTALLDACGTCVGGTTGITPNAACTDCAGVVNGTASLDACGTCAGGTTGITPNAACTDCAGVVNGTASLDACGTCVGGTTGITPNAACTDCAGVVNGTASLDACGTCAGGTTGITPNAACTDCAGVVNGTASVDACGTCAGGTTGITPNAACTDCAGVVNGTASLDACGTCAGGTTGITPNAACTDCAGVVNGTASVDACGTCAGGTTGITPNAACTDCAGVMNGTASLDACGTCAGGSTGITPNAACTDCAGVINGTASVDACGTCAGGTTGITPNAACTDCAGIVNGTASVDACGTCAGGTTGITPNAACIDCAGVINGTASLDACGTCAGGTTGITPNAACTDCAGVVNGTASVDACGTCAGGTTGITPNAACTDCAGVMNGTASLDACGTCAGGSTGITPNAACTDCAGVINGTASVDACGTCAGGTTGITPDAACTDCAGVVNGTASVDACGICSGGTTGITPDAACTDCAGVVNGTASVDACGTCAGGITGITPNAACTDCAGIVNGTASLDACGTCAGGTTGITPNAACTDCAGVVNGTASVDACGTCAGGTTGITPNAACLDCAGIPNGTNVPGSACNDNLPNTVNETWTNDCQCIGTVVTCSSEAGPDQVLCDGITTLAAVGTGSWSGPSSISFANAASPNTTIGISVPGTYELTWTVSVPGCTATDVVSITLNPTNNAAFQYSASAYCYDHATVLPTTAIPGGTFSSTSGLSIDPTTGAIHPVESIPGTYGVTHTIPGSCPSTATATVTIRATPDASWTPPTSLCSNEALLDLNTLINGDNGGNWSGSGVSGSLFNPASQQGEVVITRSIAWGDCVHSSTGTIMVNATPVANAGPDLAVCGYEKSLAAVLTSGSGVWNIPAALSAAVPTSPNAIVSGTSAGTYALIWTVTAAGCTSSDTMQLIMHDPADALEVWAGSDQLLEVVANADLTAQQTPGANIQWQLVSGSGRIEAPFASSTPVHGLALGTNTFIATVSLGQCTGATDTVNIVVEDLFIPQGFSPNGDGDNDRFEVTGMMAYPGSNFSVFNRWGQKVYENDSYANEWDGSSRTGQPLPNDTYFYVLNLTGDRAYNGFVVIKR